MKWRVEHDPQLCACVYLAILPKSGWRRQTINVCEGAVFYPLYHIVNPCMEWHSLQMVKAQFQSFVDHRFVS